MSGTFKKMRPRVINYRSCRDSSNETFRVSLINNLSNEVFVISDDGLEKKIAKQSWIPTTNSFAPIKKKYARCNQMPFMT